MLCRSDSAVGGMESGYMMSMEEVEAGRLLTATAMDGSPVTESVKALAVALQVSRYLPKPC